MPLVRSFLAATLSVASVAPASAQDMDPTFAPSTAAAMTAIEASTPAAPRDPLRFPVGEGSLKLSLQGGAQFVAEKNAFWNLSDSFAPDAGFGTDPAWGEGYLNVGAVYNRPGSVANFTAGVSVIASGTLGRDIFDFSDQGAVLFENAYGTLDIGLGGDTRLIFSGGAQPYRVGSGMLIGDGGADGFERGALVFGPRQAFAVTGLAKLQAKGFSIEGFYLTPNELPSADTQTAIVGFRAQYMLAPNRFIGIAYGQVPQSDAAYIKAAPGGIGVPTIIPGGRDGLSFWNGYFNVAPFDALPGLWIAGDFAYERNARIDMTAEAGRIEIGYSFSGAKWRPTLSYAYQRFSGDNPNTPELERFDPLFYDGSQAGWASGTNGSFVWINTNIRAHRLALATQPSPRDMLTFRYAYVMADQLGSPLQFGQGTRPVFGPDEAAVVTGVIEAPLSNDILVEYTHILTPNIFLSAGVGHSWAGRGLKSTANGVADWTGGFANIVVNY
jgi:hypothetical protein